MRPAVQLGCCLALVLVPLLLLATPQRATLHDMGHHAGAGVRRADISLVRLSASWTTPVVFGARVSPKPRGHAPTTTATAAVTDGGPHTRVVNVSFRRVLASTTTTTSARPAAAPSVPALPQAPPPPPPTGKGLATWYGAPAGTCASPTLRFGTVVTVTDVSTGEAVHCVVDDREAHNPGRVIDLAPATFSQLAGLEVGLVEVRLSW